MTFDEWFTRRYGKRPSSVRGAVLTNNIVELRARLRDAEDLKRQCDEWDAVHAAARAAWEEAK